jgi:hypothetical protein
MTYAPKAAPGLKVGAGMFEPPITMTSQIWDDNISWEGAWQQFARSAGSGLAATATAAQVVLSEVEAGDDAMMFAESGEVSYRAGDRSLSLTVTDFKYKDADQVAAAVYSGALDTRNSNLSRTDADGRVIGFVSRFHLIDIIGRTVVPTGHRDYPLAFTIDWVRNLDAVNDQNTGLWLEASAGRAERLHTLQVNYVFARLEQEATLSPYVFDDLERATNQTMNYAQVSYVTSTHMNLEFAGILTRPILVSSGLSRRTLARFQFSARVTF